MKIPRQLDQLTDILGIDGKFKISARIRGRIPWRVGCIHR